MKIAKMKGNLFGNGHRTGRLDEVIGGGGGCVVEEGLRRGGQGFAGFGHQHEGPLNGVAAVQNGGFRAGYAASASAGMR